MKSSNPFQPRKPAGVPTGGQFAAKNQAEPGYGLDGDDLVEVVEAPDSGWTEPPLSPEAALEQATKSGRYWGTRYGVSAEDVASDTLEAYLGVVRNRRDSKQVSLRSESAYIHAVARNIAARSIAGAERAEDRSAWTAYQLWAGTLDHKPTDEECDQAAERIRLAQPPRRRARPGFHRRKETAVPLPLDEVASTSPGVLATADAGFDFDDPRDPDIELPDRPTNPREVADLRRKAWTMVAPDAPQPAVESLTSAAAHKARRQVEASEGPLKLARRWYEGDATPEQTEALFAPFGNLDHRQRAAVVRELTSRPRAAGMLWDAAMTASTIPRRRSKQPVPVGAHDVSI